MPWRTFEKVRISDWILFNAEYNFDPKACHPQSKVRNPALRSSKHPDVSSAKNRTSFTEADDTLTLVDLLVEDNGIQVLLAKSFQ